MRGLLLRRLSTRSKRLEISPANRLQAKVEISDRDIGFVRVGLPVSVSVDSFPSGEFGYINGTLSKLGSDALPPDQRSQAYRFLQRSNLKSNLCFQESSN